MDSGFYAACTALLARNQALDSVANNLANVSTPGYRGQHECIPLASCPIPRSATYPR